MGEQQVLSFGTGTPRTIAEALEGYGSERLEHCREDEQPGVEPVLEILASFVDEVAGALLDPMTRRRVERRFEDQAELPRAALEPRWLLRLLAPCARLFPVQIVAGAGVVGAFDEELPRLARWLVHQRLGAAEDEIEFRAAWPAARADLQRHLALQRAIELDLEMRPLVPPGDVVDRIVGNFEILRVGPAGMWVRADGCAYGPVRIPRQFADLYEEGHEVPAAFQRAVIGWRVLASALPSPAGTVTRMMEEMAP